MSGILDSILNIANIVGGICFYFLRLFIQIFIGKAALKWDVWDKGSTARLQRLMAASAVFTIGPLLILISIKAAPCSKIITPLLMLDAAILYLIIFLILIILNSLNEYLKKAVIEKNV